MEETSLTDFVGDASDEAESAAGSADREPDPPTDPDATAATADETDPVVPAETTAAWSPAGGACEECGASAIWRWREAGALVCQDCKSW